MKQSYDLLKYIHCYLYNYEAESVCFAESPDRSDAIEAYHRFAQEHNIYENDLRLWMYDVALDCIRTLPKEQWELFLDVEDPILLHFEYGMYIRMALILTLLQSTRKTELLKGKEHMGIVCDNEKCITHAEPYLPKSFTGRDTLLVCEYCDHRLLLRH